MIFIIKSEANNVNSWQFLHRPIAVFSVAKLLYVVKLTVLSYPNSCLERRDARSRC